MTLKIGDEAPNFKAKTTTGEINFHEWIENNWAILFSHPKSFTPVCTTELGYMAGLKNEFDKRKWLNDIKETQGNEVNYPLICDTDKKISDLYGMIHPNASDTLTVRTVFIIDPDKKIKLMLSYPASTGRNFDEILRVVDSLQLTSKHQVATPVNWKNGDNCIIIPAVDDNEAKKKFPKGWDSPKPYIRIVPQPKD